MFHFVNGGWGGGGGEQTHTVFWETWPVPFLFQSSVRVPWALAKNWKKRMVDSSVFLPDPCVTTSVCATISAGFLQIPYTPHKKDVSGRKDVFRKTFEFLKKYSSSAEIRINCDFLNCKFILQVGTIDSKYALSIGSKLSGSSNMSEYEDFTAYNGMKFTTVDKDNDNYEGGCGGGNCAVCTCGG